MDQIKALNLKSAIKHLLKNKKSKYSDLAEHLDCSEVTIKRILGQEELSLSRLLQICEYLDVDLAELEKISQEQIDKENPEYTDEQQEFLADNPNHFAFLMKLYQKSVDELVKDFSLNKKSLDNYLINLEKHNLIVVSNNGKVSPFYKKPPGLGSGKLSKKYMDKIINNSSKYMKKRIGELIYSNKDYAKENPGHYTVQIQKARPETIKSWGEQLVKLIDEFHKISKYETKAFSEEELKTSVIVLGAVIDETEPIKRSFILDTFGEVKNL